MEVVGHYHSERDLEMLGHGLAHCTSLESFELVNLESIEEEVQQQMVGSTGSGKTVVSSAETEYLDALCEQCEYPETCSAAFDSDFEDVSQFLPTAVLKKR